MFWHLADCPETMKSSGQTRPPLAGQHFQVAVIGGGLVGIAIARECARAGKRTLLVEQNDFGSGATSRSPRVFSGLRALETGNIGLAREILRDRQQLLREFPHLLRPSHFMMAVGNQSSRSALSARSALWLYRRMASSSLDPSAFELEHKKLERALDSTHDFSLFDYEDVLCEFPERLAAAWLSDAAAAGAVIRNHLQVLAVDLAHNRARGLLLRDWTTNIEQRVEATHIINASGAWTDRLCQRSSIKLRRPLSTSVRSSYIVVSYFPGAPATPLYAEALNGRPLSIVPWNEQLLIGSGETIDPSDPGRITPSPKEIEYLQQSLLKLFPKARVVQPELRYAFSGIRSVPFAPDLDPAKISGQHTFHDHTPDGATRLISVIGGSLASARIIARECADLVGARAAAAKPVKLAPGEALLDHWAAELAEEGGINEDTARSIIEWHGTRAYDIVRMAHSSVELRTPLCPHTEHIVAEAVHAYTQEFAVTLGDVLLRRVPVAMGPCWSEACSREAVLLIGAVVGWNDQAAGTALEAFETERNAFLQRAPRPGMRLVTAAD
jgi:glycerol-3-phosphate dehydrogenase